MNPDQNMKLQTVDPSALAPNPWNTNHCSPDLEARLDNSIRKLGMFKPVVVRELEDGSLQILGGEHRAQSAARVGLTEIPIFNLGRISDKKAKQIGVVDNARYGQDDSLQLAKLLEEIGTIEDLSSYTPFSDGDLTDIFSSVHIDLDLLDHAEIPDEPAVKLPEKTNAALQTHQTMNFRVQIEDVEKISAKVEKVMKLQGFTGADAKTNAGDALAWIMSRVEV